MNASSHIALRLAFAVAGMALAACASAPSAEVPARSAAGASVVDRVAIALFDGDRAETAGSGAARDLAEVSRFLAAAGARPAEDSDPNLERRWADLARAHGQPLLLPPDRGRPLGPAYRRARIAPGQMASLQQLFLAGQRAEIALMPTQPAALVLEVNDADGRPICRQRAEDPPAKCAWLPVYTTRHSIVVKNEGRAPADYFLVVN